MTANSKRGGTLRAVLREVERGLFYATYISHARETDILELPTYGLGTSASQVKRQMEKSIHTFGYGAIVWEDAGIPPQSHSSARAPDLLSRKVSPLSE